MVLGGRVLHQLLGDSLRRAHHARRANGLVGRDQHEMLHVHFDGCVDDVPGSRNVVRHGLENVVLHQGHMLVRGRVEDRMRTVLLENVEDPRPVTHIRDHRNDLHIGEAQRELLEDVEDRILAVAEEDEARGSEAGQLPAKLRSDRSTRPGNQYRLTRRQLGHRRQIGLDGVATKQILNLDFAKPGRVTLAGDDLGEAWNRACRNATAQCRPHNLSNHRSRRGRHRDDDLGDAKPLDDLRDVGQRSEYRKAGQHVAVLRGIGVYEADRLETELIACEKLLDHELAGVARAGDQYALAFVVLAASGVAGAVNTGHQAREGDQCASQERIEEYDGERYPGRGEAGDRQNHDADDGADESTARGRDQDRLQLADAGVAPEPAVHAGQEEYEES